MSDHIGERSPDPSPGPFGMSWDMVRLPDGTLPSLADWEELVLFLFLCLGEL